ncbi:MAG: hypothetical protein GF350_01805 [Chitinivibrionales bacterium]|nr:hypothetical protein [Chitinivibrionales bacterium]
METKNVQRMTLRLPRQTYDKLQELRERKPHLSLHAIIVEALEQELSREERREDIESGKTQINPDALRRS